MYIYIYIHIRVAAAVVDNCRFVVIVETGTTLEYKR